jgi:hypothetical protein
MAGKQTDGRRNHEESPRSGQRSRAGAAGHGAQRSSRPTAASLTKTVRSDVTTAARAECGVAGSIVGKGGGVRGVITYNGSCVGFQQASIAGHIPGLTERVRFWKNGGLPTTKWVTPELSRL